MSRTWFSLSLLGLCSAATLALSLLAAIGFASSFGYYCPSPLNILLHVLFPMSAMIVLMISWHWVARLKVRSAFWLLGATAAAFFAVALVLPPLVHEVERLAGLCP